MSFYQFEYFIECQNSEKIECTMKQIFSIVFIFIFVIFFVLSFDDFTQNQLNCTANFIRKIFNWQNASILNARERTSMCRCREIKCVKTHVSNISISEFRRSLNSSSTKFFFRNYPIHTYAHTFARSLVSSQFESAAHKLFNPFHLFIFYLPHLFAFMAWASLLPLSSIECRLEEKCHCGW